MDDISKGGVHKTDGFWWVIFPRGEYTKPMGCVGFWKVFYRFENLSARLLRLFIFILSYYPVPRPGSPPTPSHGPMTFLITQNGAKDYQNLETLTVQGANSFWNNS